VNFAEMPKQTALVAAAEGVNFSCQICEDSAEAKQLSRCGEEVFGECRAVGNESNELTFVHGERVKEHGVVGGQLV